MPKVSVIITTYDRPEWLEKAFWGYETQTEKDFEIIVADDGSKHNTARLVEWHRKRSYKPIIHVWHESEGLQKNKILNKAIQTCASDYIIITDANCIPRKDFVEKHLRFRQRNHFLSSNYQKLPESIFNTIVKEDVISQTCFNPYWFQKGGFKKTTSHIRLNPLRFGGWILDKITFRKPVHNSVSCWMQDILTINGFDERLSSGCEDGEISNRLINYGIRPIHKRIRDLAICLDLQQSDVAKDTLEVNKHILEKTRNDKLFVTPNGIMHKVAR